MVQIFVVAGQQHESYTQVVNIENSETMNNLCVICGSVREVLDSDRLGDKQRFFTPEVGGCLLLF